MSSSKMCRKPYREKVGGPVDPVDLPAFWGFYGDSQTAGRATETNAVNHYQAFSTVWSDSGYTATSSEDDQGVSGRSLANTLTYCLGRTHVGTPWIHLQESGNQNADGQRTASEWGDTFETGVNDILTEWPGATISYETAYSFSDARKAQAYRNWSTYNTELRARVSSLAGEGKVVKIVEVEDYIEQLVAEIGYDVVCFADDIPNAYHYRGIGNFMIALAIFKAFNYDVTTLDHSGIACNASHKTTAVNLVAG